MERVVLSCLVLPVQGLTMILPLVGHPCKFWSLQILKQIQAKLQRKKSQRESAGEVHPAEKRRSDKFASPCDKSCHDEAPEDGSGKKSSKENCKISWLRSARDGCENRCAEACPKDNIHGIA